MKLFAFLLYLCLSLSFSLQARGKSVLPDVPNDTAFLMAIEDVFTISGVGVIATGVVESGTISPGNKLEIKGGGDKVITTTIGSVSINNSSVASAKKGDKIALNLKAVSATDIKRGMVAATPGSIQTYTQIEGYVKLLTKEEGGSSFPLKDQGIQLIIRTDEVSAKAMLSGGELKPGESSTFLIQLNDPTVFKLTDKFSIKLYGKIIGTGSVTKLIN